MKKIRINNRRRFIISVVVLLLVVQFLFNLTTGFDHAEGKASKEYKYISYEIKRNDTLWNIASLYKPSYETIPSYINEIKTINNMQSNLIRTGETIIVPIIE